MPSLLSLGSGAYLYGSSSFLSEVFLHCPDFSSSSSSWLASFGFPSVCTGFSFPRLFVPCARLWGLHLSYYLLPLPHHLWGSSVHCFPSTGRGSPCRGSCFPFLFIVTPSGVPCRSSVWFLIFLLSLFALMASSSSVNSLPSSTGFSHPLVARWLGVPPSRHPSVHLLVGGWSSSMALLLHGLLPPLLHLAIVGSFSISLGLPPLLRCCGSLSCPLLWLSCRSTCLLALLLLGVSCSSLGLLGASFSASCCLYAVLLPPSSFLSAILPLSFLLSFLLWSTSRHFDVCLPWLLSLPFQCAPISFFLYGRLVDLPGFPALRLLPWFPFLSLSFRSSLHVLL